jgi:hypothetical protein
MPQLNSAIEKTSSFQDNTKLNQLLEELKAHLHPVQTKVQKSFKQLQWPVGFIIGNPRSGTTLFLQWIANQEHFAYPSNLLNRFAYAPYIGALIQKMLFDKDYDFGNELSDIQSTFKFESNLGKSRGALAPCEFYHFFRNFMPNTDPGFLNDDEIKHVDFKGISQGLCSIENAFQKPFFVKGIMLQFNLIKLFAQIPALLFIYIQRKPFYIMQSLLLARESYYNDRSVWWSVKPKEYNWLKDLDVFHQIAGQVYFTRKSIETSLLSIPQKNKIVIDYEYLCENPIQVFDKIRAKYQEYGYIIKKEYTGPDSFQIRNEKKISDHELLKFEKAYKAFEQDDADRS